MKTKTIPQSLIIHSTAALRIALLSGALFLASPAFSQEAAVAHGKIGPLGEVYGSAVLAGGSLSVTRLALGQYSIEVTAPGAFGSATTEDFVLHATPTDSASDDEIAVVQIESVTPDAVLARVRLADVEVAANLDGQAPVDTPFYFSLLRIGTGPLDASSRFLAATGRVAADGTLLSVAHAESLSFAASRSSEGNYELVLSGAGAFASDGIHHYALTLGVYGGGVTDEIIRGNNINTTSDDEVVFRVILDDAQDVANDNLQTPADRPFAFAIHRLHGAAAGELPESRLLLALARVDGSNGALLRGGTSLPGLSLSSQRNSTGRYRLVLQQPGRFAGRLAHEFVALPQVQFSGYADEFAAAQASVFDNNTLHIDVAVNDVENGGTNLGTAEDGDFGLILLDSRAVQQADIKIGRKPQTNSMRGDDRYSSTFAGQTLRIKAKGRRLSRYHQAVENDGSVTDRLAIRAKHFGRRVRVQHRRIGSGGGNVTAAMRGSGLQLADVAPEGEVRFQTRSRFAGKKGKRAGRIDSRAFSLSGGTTDAVRVRLKQQP